MNCKRAWKKSPHLCNVLFFCTFVLLKSLKDTWTVKRHPAWTHMATWTQRELIFVVNFYPPNYHILVVCISIQTTVSLDSSSYILQQQKPSNNQLSFHFMFKYSDQHLRCWSKLWRRDWKTERLPGYLYISSRADCWSLWGIFQCCVHTCTRRSVHTCDSYPCPPWGKGQRCRPAEEGGGCCDPSQSAIVSGQTST